MAIIAFRAANTRRSSRAARARRRDNALMALGLALCAAQIALVPMRFLPRHAALSQPAPSTPPPAEAAPLPPDVMQTDLPDPQAPLSVQTLDRHGVRVVLVEGGIPSTRRSPQRAAVVDFVADSGAQAGLNGTFFTDASLRGTDNRVIGPTLCGNEPSLTPDEAPAQKLAGRPLVLLAPGRTRILAYDPQTMDSDASLRRLLPGVTDAFLGGVWLVHDDIAATRMQRAAFQVKDAEDPRRRAFFALTDDGRPALGATDSVATSGQLARSLQDSGLSDAVLMDSGFSTSLVLGKRILVTGHTAPGLASRPVPHAIVLFAPHPAAKVLIVAKNPPSATK